MSDEAAKKPLWSAREIAEAPRAHIRHPWNPQSDVHMLPLSTLAGLERVMLSVARIPPGKESFVYHSHERDEEFLFILSGRGRTEIDGVWHEIGPGDFMGFRAPGPAHHLTNPYAEDLVYLMGGERSGLDVGHFPKLGKKIVFAGSGIWSVKDSDAVSMAPTEWLARDEE